MAVVVGGRTRQVDIAPAGVLLDGRRVSLDAVRFGDTWSVVVGPAASGAGLSSGRSYDVAVTELASGELIVDVNGRQIVVSTATGAARSRSVAGGLGARGQHDGSAPVQIVAPMPGRVAKVLVKVGDTVSTRQGVVVVEAMKMENELRSPKAGIVVDVRVVEGARVDARAVLVVVE